MQHKIVTAQRQTKGLKLDANIRNGHQKQTQNKTLFLDTGKCQSSISAVFVLKLLQIIEVFYTAFLLVVVGQHCTRHKDKKLLHKIPLENAVVVHNK